jgi:hypothetical protein
VNILHINSRFFLAILQSHIVRTDSDEILPWVSKDLAPKSHSPCTVIDVGKLNAVLYELE